MSKDRFEAAATVTQAEMDHLDQFRAEIAEQMGIPELKRAKLIRCHFDYVKETQRNEFKDWTIARLVKDEEDREQSAKQKRAVNEAIDAIPQERLLELLKEAGVDLDTLENLNVKEQS